MERLQEFFVYLATPYSKFPLDLNAAFAQANVLACRLVTRGVRLYCPIVSTHPKLGSGSDAVPLIYSDIDWIEDDDGIWIEAQKPSQNAQRTVSELRTCGCVAR